MELVATWWPAALAGLICLVVSFVVILLTGGDFDDEVSGRELDLAMYLLFLGAPVAAAVLVGPLPDLATAFTGLIAVVVGLGVDYLVVQLAVARYIGPRAAGRRTRSKNAATVFVALGAAIATILVLGVWLPAALGMTAALVIASAALLAIVLGIRAQFRAELASARGGSPRPPDDA